MLCSLTKDKNKKCIHHPLLAIDFENDPKTGKFICAALYGYRKDHHKKEHLIDEYYEDAELLYKRILELRDKGKNIPFHIIVFNGGYDHVFLEPIINDKTLLYGTSRFITARIKTLKPSKGERHSGIKIIDLCNHVDGSLEDWIKHLDMENKYGIKKESLDNLEVRCRSDTKATYYLGSFLEDFYVHELGIGLKLTVSSASLAYFRKKHFKYYFERESQLPEVNINDYERMAMRGGRTECFVRGEQTVHSYDVNSMYLSVMRDAEIPDPNTTRYYNNPVHWKEHFEQYLGIFKCRVYAPESKVMCLPYSDGKTKKLIFPCGEFTGVWTNVELKEALNNGYKILECYNYVIYKKSHKLFESFAKEIWDLRKKYKAAGNKGMDLMVKKLGNGQYGKYGQQNGEDGYYGKLEDFDGEIEGNPCISIINGVEYISISSKTKTDSEHTFPCIPAFILAYARIKLYRMLKKHEEDVVYCDTDSIKFRGENNEVSSKELGEFGYEYTETQWFYKPKMYGAKLKGVPKRAKQYSTIADHKMHAVYEKPNRFKESIRRGLIPNQWVSMDKVIGLEDDKRIWDGNESRPIKM
jgi:hypothetical protein